MTFEYVRGHGVTWIEGYFYAKFEDGKITWDPNDPVYAERECFRCGKKPTKEGHDACLGTLKGVKFACCGHGRIDHAYIVLDDGRHIEGQAALDYFKEVREL